MKKMKDDDFGSPRPFLRTARGEVWSEFDDKPAGDRWRRLSAFTQSGRVCLPVDLFGLDEDAVDQDARSDRRIVTRRRFDRLFADTGYLGAARPGTRAVFERLAERVKSAVFRRLARGYDPGLRDEEHLEEGDTE